MLGAVPALAQSSAGADPADPAAPVPPTRYLPMPAPPSAAPAASPAANWKALNRAVAESDSMAPTSPATQPEPVAPSHHEHKAVK